VDKVKADTLGKGDVKLDKGKAKAVDELGHVEGSDLGTKVQTTEPAPKRRSIRASKSAITMVSLSQVVVEVGQQMCFGLGCLSTEDSITQDTPSLILQRGSMLVLCWNIGGDRSPPDDGLSDSSLAHVLDHPFTCLHSAFSITFRSATLTRIRPPQPSNTSKISSHHLPSPSYCA
jgi:hypothetical protein